MKCSKILSFARNTVNLVVCAGVANAVFILTSCNNPNFHDGRLLSKKSDSKKMDSGTTAAFYSVKQAEFDTLIEVKDYFEVQRTTPGFFAELQNTPISELFPAELPLDDRVIVFF